jgi:predicted dienelactone hydrolase
VSNKAKRNTMSGRVPIRHPYRRARRLTRAAALLAGIMLSSALPSGPTTPAVAASSVPVQLSLPEPTGHRPVGTVSLHVIDPSRPDPWVPALPVRELVIQFWYPAATVHGYPRAPWMTPATTRAYERSNGLPAGVLKWPTTHAYVGAPVDRRGGRRPVVLYSHGLGGQRTETTALVEDLASHGYIVITVDHVHDAGAVELPDGRLEAAAIPELTKDNEVQVTTKAIEARVRDTRFVLDQLARIDRGDNPDAEHRRLPGGLRGALDFKHVGMMGHSDGGATTAAATPTEPRITAGINLDGTLWSPDAMAGSKRPLLLMGRQDHNRDTDPTWAKFWANQRGAKLQLNLTGSTHATFHDFAVLLPQAAPALGMSPEQVARGVGAINGQRAVTILRAYLNAYFDLHLRHRNDHLLDGASARYPEIQFTP